MGPTEPSIAKPLPFSLSVAFATLQDSQWCLLCQLQIHRLSLSLPPKAPQLRLPCSLLCSLMKLDIARSPYHTGPIPHWPIRSSWQELGLDHFGNDQEGRAELKLEASWMAGPERYSGAWVLATSHILPSACVCTCFRVTPQPSKQNSLFLFLNLLSQRESWSHLGES